MPTGVYKRKPFTEEHKRKISEFLKGRKRPEIAGDKCYNWKGDNVGYRGIHHWMEKILGKPNYCEHCKKENKKKYEWANIDHKYKRKVSDYIRLCTKCHRKYDYSKNKT